MKVMTVKRLDPGQIGQMVEINLTAICMVGDFKDKASDIKNACVITLANGQVCAIEISRAELKKNMECK